MLTPEKLRNKMESIGAYTLVFDGECADCGADTKVVVAMDAEGKMIIAGGALYDPCDVLDEIEPRCEGAAMVVKCEACFAKNPRLPNSQPCEVYSRVVGYLRPVNQWNEGKQAEFAKRVNYGISPEFNAK